ncbi:hypothetical protein HDU96_001194 [Phlyctochytrium bullatum]|nr:hypothetical protein HDU96_001194 [Phlyctochytrium bullatum]
MSQPSQPNIITVTLLPSGPHPFVTGHAGVTDLTLTGIARLHNHTRHDLDITTLELHFEGLLTLSATATLLPNTHPTPLASSHPHTDVRIPVQPDRGSFPKLRSWEVVDVPFTVEVPASQKVFPIFKIDIDKAGGHASKRTRSAPTADGGIEASTALSSASPTLLPPDASTAQPTSGSVAHLEASNKYFLTVHATLTRYPVSGIVRASSNPTRLLQGMQPVEPEIVQALLAPGEDGPAHIETPLLPRAAGTVAHPAAIRKDGKLPLEFHLNAAHASGSVRVELKQRIRFAVPTAADGFVHASATSTVLSAVFPLRNPGPAMLDLSAAVLPPTTFACPFFHVSYALAFSLVPTSHHHHHGAAPRLFSRSPVATSTPSAPAAASPLVLAPCTPATAESAIASAPWLLLPPPPPSAEAPTPAAPVSADGKGVVAEPEVATVMAPQAPPEALVPIPMACYRPPSPAARRCMEDEPLPAYQRLVA